MRLRFALVLLVVSLLAPFARADRVHLVGGSIIEGKATREGKKVIVELESGRVTLPAESVTRIDAAPTPASEYEARLANIAPNDATALLELANFCRDHDMPNHERELLARVIAIDPNHEEARARLGYVRSGTGWVSLEEQRKQLGLVLYEGQWVTREQMLEMKRLEAETAAAHAAREKAELDLETERLAIAQRREDADREREREKADEEERRRAERDLTYGYFVPYAGYGFAYGFGYPRAYGGAGCPPGSPCPQGPHGPSGVYPAYPPGYAPGYPARPHGPPPVRTPPFGINGARDPRDMSFSLPGVRDPRSYF